MSYAHVGFPDEYSDHVFIIIPEIPKDWAFLRFSNKQDLVTNSMENAEHFVKRYSENKATFSAFPWEQKTNLAYNYEADDFINILNLMPPCYGTNLTSNTP